MCTIQWSLYHNERRWLQKTDCKWQENEGPHISFRINWWVASGPRKVLQGKREVQVRMSWSTQLKMCYNQIIVRIFQLSLLIINDNKIIHVYYIDRLWDLWLIYTLIECTCFSGFWHLQMMGKQRVIMVTEELPSGRSWQLGWHLWLYLRYLTHSHAYSHFFTHAIFFCFHSTLFFQFLQ